MTSKIDFKPLVSQIDTQNLLGSIQDFPDQVRAAWQAMEQFVLPTHFIKAQEILVLGSSSGKIAGDVVRVLSNMYGKIPVYVQSDYELPKWVSTQTLVVGVSYTGNDPEVVLPLREAGRIGVKMFGISTGGKVGSICRKYSAPHFQINYGAKSHMALGYLLMPIVGLVTKLGFIEFEDRQAIARDIAGLYEFAPRVDLNNSRDNTAKDLAQKLVTKTSLVVSSLLMKPVAERWHNQVALITKSLNWSDVFPGTISGLTNALIDKSNQQLSQDFVVINFRTSYDSDTSSIGQNIFKELVTKSRIEYEEIVARPQGSLLENILTSLLLVDYTSYYLALAKGANPNEEPAIEGFSQKFNESVIIE